MLLPKILSKLPFTVNVSGRKHDIICAIGRTIQPLPASFKLEGITVRVKRHPKAHIIGYAGINFLNNFRTSSLGKHLQATLQEGDVFVDAGANLGGFSFLAKQLGAEVFAIEADPQLADFLTENEAAFGTVKGVALSDQAGTSTFYISDENIGGNSLVMSAKGWESSGYTGQCEVETARLDTLVPKNKHIKLLKIDVEGHEEAVVNGCTGLLENQRIDQIWCEVRGPQSDRNPNSFQPVCKTLERFDFHPHTFDGVLKPFPWKTVTNAPQFFDLLFLKANEIA